ncbi:MAG: long-chain-fatty-acid--CoA ligase [Candidatus Schekmanbacteria bacterium]|nr:MAG: long-chain-fatty-acid--CoA ligase [Candidatus Schekmanbacteria bacterium]
MVLLTEHTLKKIKKIKGGEMVVGDIVRNNARNYPKKTSFIFESNRFTWAQTDERVNRLANFLLSLGLKSQDPVGLLSRNCHQWFETAFAVAKAGLKLVPLNMAFVAAELEQIANDAGIKVLIVEDTKVEIANELKKKCPTVETLIGICHDKEHGLENDFEKIIENGKPQDPNIEVSKDDVFLHIYTSGTTGVPKGAMLTHYNNVSEGICAGYEFRLLPHDIALSALPLYFIGGWGGTALPALVRGCTHVIINFDPDKFLETVQREKVSYTILVPTIINILINHPDLEKYDLSSIRVIPFAGSPLPVELWKRAAAKFGNVFQSIYGLTEVCATITVLPPEEVSLEGDAKKVERLASIGKAMIGSAARVVDDDMNDIKPGSGEVGEIVLRGNTVMKGYWNAPEITEETFRGGWLHTGDLAQVDEDGFIYITDRKKDLIISGGKNVYPREVEEVLYKHEAILDACVIGVPDEKWGETVKAVVVLKEGKNVAEEEIIEFCKQHLASYKKPTSVDIVKELPRTSSGKILKRKVREKYWEGKESKLV